MKDIIARIRGRLFITRCKLWRKNIQIHNGLRIYKKLIITGKGNVIIGKNCLIGGIIGDNKQFVSIDTQNVSAIIRIGCNARLYAARINARYNISIGDDVLIEEADVLDTNFHNIERNRGEPSDENEISCRVTIGNRVSVGSRSIITKGVTIGDDVVVLPGAIVGTSIRDGRIVIGNPAKLLG